MNTSPMLRTRREFLGRTVLGAAASATVPGFLMRTWAALDDAAKNAAVQAATGKDARILVVLQMAGGNDGLNTVIPIENDHYRRARRRLAVSATEALRLNDDLAWHPELKGFRSLADEGRLSVIQGVGYPNPNRSHFRSTEIWQTASDANRYEREGWLGRYFDHACAGADPTVAVNLGRQTPQAFVAKTPTGVSLAMNPGGRGAGGLRAGRATPGDTGETDEAMAGASIEGVGADAGGRRGSVLDFLDRTALDARYSSGRVREILSQGGVPAGYPESPLAQSLGTVARLIAGGLPTRVYYVSQGGYDTHRDQAGSHGRLLAVLGDSVRAFVDDLKSKGLLERVLLVTFSEFGRRVEENASGGTDHGAAGPMFVVGENRRKTVVGDLPSLAPERLSHGDLRFGIDFRRVYAGILEGWLGTSSEKVLGSKFEPIPV